MFDTHMLNDDGKEAVKNFKSLMSKSMTAALELLPEGRDKAIFMTKIEEGMFFATKAIASKPGNFTEVIRY